MPCYARFGLERHEFCPEPDPSIKPLHQAVALWKHIDGIHDFTVEEPEIAGVRRNDHVASGLQQVIVSTLEQALWQGFGPCFLDGRNDLETVAPLFQKHGDERRRMLA